MALVTVKEAIKLRAARHRWERGGPDGDDKFYNAVENWHTIAVGTCLSEMAEYVEGLPVKVERNDGFIGYKEYDEIEYQAVKPDGSLWSFHNGTATCYFQPKAK